MTNLEKYLMNYESYVDQRLWGVSKGKIKVSF